MSEGRSLINPKAISLGVRPLTVPGQGNLLVASSFFAWRLADGAPLSPADWYQIVALSAGKNTIPDSLCPVPGAEVMILGPASACLPDEPQREAEISVGTVHLRLRLSEDPQARGEPLHTGPHAAVWHAQDNPWGRGGPDDERPALIVDRTHPQHPVWLGPTPLDHPLRLRLVGPASEKSAGGWPTGTDPAVLCDAHPALRTQALYPGERIVVEGLSRRRIETEIPRYRITMGSAHYETWFEMRSARIHTLALIPAVGVGAMIWRCTIPVGDDILGMKQVLMLAALEDMDAPHKDPDHWSRIAAQRLQDPSETLDERPLLPEAMAANAVPPWVIPEQDDHVARKISEAREWMEEEAGIAGANPFEGKEPAAVKTAIEAIEHAEDESAPPNATDAQSSADAVLATARERHEAAGFTPPEIKEERDPVVRGQYLEEEIRRRLEAPYQGQIERQIAYGATLGEVEAADPTETLAALANVRILSPRGMLTWEALDENEGARLGNAALGRWAERPFERHIDLSSARFDGEDRAPLRTLRIDGLLAEETTWDLIHFVDCAFTDSTLAAAVMRHCRFERCTFDGVNLSRMTLIECDFEECVFNETRPVEQVIVQCRFTKCTFENCTSAETTLQSVVWRDGTWKSCQIIEELWGEVVFEDMTFDEVSISETQQWKSTYRRCTMDKVFFMGKGLAYATIEDVSMDRSAAIGYAKLDGSTLARTRITRSGFTSTSFKDVAIAPSCSFEACDFGLAQFTNTTLDQVQFVRCTFAGSVWSGAQARAAWMIDCALRGVDFADTELGQAVLCGSDVEGVKMLPEKTIGTDFSGTVRGAS